MFSINGGDVTERVRCGLNCLDFILVYVLHYNGFTQTPHDHFFRSRGSGVFVLCKYKQTLLSDVFSTLCDQMHFGGLHLSDLVFRVCGITIEPRDQIF